MDVCYVTPKRQNVMVFAYYPRSARDTASSVFVGQPLELIYVRAYHSTKPTVF